MLLKLALCTSDFKLLILKKNHTLLLSAFRRKNALQLSQVIAPKLYPKALSPQTAHIFGIFVSVLFGVLAGSTRDELLEVGESHRPEFGLSKPLM